ncbi:MAG: ribosomal RNA small subunit methyltransferase A, partial [bacterium]|nr:ribosomal RNA small subunit methyltransferase A [bacterium]
MVVHVQTKTEIRGILDSLGLRPQKRFGQHFLMDGNLMRQLADGAEIGGGDAVVEVGPGTGGLTDLLADAAAAVLAVEIDRGLAAFLTQQYADRPQVRILNTDVLANKNRLSPSVTGAVAEMAATTGGRCLLVANLPYNVATPLL